MILEVLDRISAIPKYILEHTCLKRQLIELLKPGRVPRHIGFIMDGNRRFAKERGLPTRDGHRAGTRALIHALESCFEIGIKEVSIYAFSIENFNRPKEEVDDILNLLKDNLKKISEKSIIQKHKTPQKQTRPPSSLMSASLTSRVTKSPGQFNKLPRSEARSA
ncbi:hypothetical protein OXX79_010308 [Metschnikowia pulcherrima]